MNSTSSDDELLAEAIELSVRETEELRRRELYRRESMEIDYDDTIESKSNKRENYINNQRITNGRSSGNVKKKC